jgi:hypothetical protein
LHEEPYKKHSYFIWSSFKSIGVKCFAYVPCEANDYVDKIFVKKRQTGKCFDGIKVMVFDSIEDYNQYMSNQLDISQLNSIKENLLNKSDQFTPIRKKNFKCYPYFSYFPEKMEQRFAIRYLKSETERGSTRSMNHSSANKNLTQIKILENLDKNTSVIYNENKTTNNQGTNNTGNGSSLYNFFSNILKKVINQFN